MTLKGKLSWHHSSQKHDYLHIIWLRGAMLSFHSIDCQCFGSYEVSQLISVLSVGMAHTHMSVLPSCLGSSSGCAMLSPHLVKLFCCNKSCKMSQWFQWPDLTPVMQINANYRPLIFIIDFDRVKKSLLSLNR